MSSSFKELMLPQTEVYALSGLMFIVLDLIVTGIIGIIRKEIYPKSIFLYVFFIPLGMMGKIFGYFYSSIDTPETGKAAIASGIATIALGFLILIFFGFYYLDNYNLIDYGLTKILVPLSLVLLLFLVPSSIMILNRLHLEK